MLMPTLIKMGYQMAFKSDNKVVQVAAIAFEPKQGESREGDACERPGGLLACFV